MSPRRRGFTMLEMMMVVAIISVISALAAASVVSVIRIGRVNAATTALTRALVDARLRSMTQRCAHVAQVNGPFYNPASAGVGAPKTPGSVAVIRKANCNATGTDLRYQAGTNEYDRDRVLNVTILGDDSLPTRGVRLFAPTPSSFFSATAGELTFQAVAVGYNSLGASFLNADTVGDGTFSTGLTSTDLTLGVTSPVEAYDGGTSAQTVSVPANSVPRRL